MTGADAPVVLVHGIWMSGLELVLLGRRLRRAGYETSIFSYRSLRCTPAENAASLRRHIETLDVPAVHLVGHSLGCLAILHLFDRFPETPCGRVVFLGAPVRGSAVARILASHALTRPLVGRSVVRGLLGDVPAWAGRHPLGTIAGNRGIGVGQVVGGLDGPSDGTVALSETVTSGAIDALVLPVSHTGLLVSRSVADEVAHFLAVGRFRDAATVALGDTP